MGARTLLTALRNRPDGNLYEIWEEADGTVKWYCNELDHQAEHVTLAGWDDLRFPVQGINPAGAVNAPAVDTAVFPGTLLFDSAIVNTIVGVAQMPHAWLVGSSIHPHIHWAKTSAAAGGVVWEFRYAIAGIGGVFGAYSAYEACTNPIPSSDTLNKHAVAAWSQIDMTNFGESTMIVWQLQRNTAAAGDTYAADARLFEFDIHFQVSRFGSVSEF